MLTSTGDSYIFSTCIHNEDSDSYKDGLLSMWRGYGSEGGYAIQFNKHNLVKLFYNEKTCLNGKVCYEQENTLKESTLKNAIIFL